MSDIMQFPNTVDEFMELYKMTDTKQVYSNGTEYVPIFRMKQWFEHEEAKRTAKVYNFETIGKFTFGSCGACSAPVAVGDNYCNQCGSRLEWK